MHGQDCLTDSAATLNTDKLGSADDKPIVNKQQRETESRLNNVEQINHTV